MDAKVRGSRLSRETRLLLVTIGISVASLWVLARIRFADRPVSPNPIGPVLTQLAPPVFDQLSSALFQVQMRLTPIMIGIETKGRGSSLANHRSTISAMRFGTDTAVALLGEATVAEDADVFPAVNVAGWDPASGLAILRLVPGQLDDASPQPSSRRPPASRYIVAAEVTPAGVSARPVFVGALQSIESPLWWSEVVWELPEKTLLSPGTFVFTTDGAFVGLIADSGERLAIIPAETVKTAVNRLAAEGRRAYGHLGIKAQPLTAGTALSTGAQTGVVVTSIDANGPAAEQLQVADVIEAAGDKPLPTFEHWRAIAARLTAGEKISLQVRRHAAVRTVTLIAAPLTKPVKGGRLGLTMRTIRGVGVEVLTVIPASAADRAGIQVGDVITVTGDRKALTPAQITRAFTAATAEKPLLVAVTRGTAHHVLTLEP